MSLALFTRTKLRISQGKPKPAKREKNGLWELSGKEANAKGCVDVIAVHGLGGDAYGTWTHENGKLWLRDFLPAQISEARICTYGYDSVVAFSKSSAEVDDFARDLLHRVKGIRKSTLERTRPLFFICHSLGGILLKQAINIAHQDTNNYGDLLKKFAGVAFMGTPHGGSDIAFWMSYAGRMLNAASLGTRTNKALLQILRKDSEFLGSLSMRFEVQNSNQPILSFYEMEKFPMMNCRIVEKESAQLNLPNETLLPIQADHRAMCRFPEKTSQKYIPVAEAIINMVRRPSVPDAGLSQTSSQYRPVLNGWLDPVTSTDDFERIQGRRLKGSCRWIEQDTKFQEWLEYGGPSVLVIEGPPGCGKSTLTTRIIELLQDAQNPVAYFFCDAKDSARQSWKQILRTWTWQLLQQKSQLVDDVFQIYVENSGMTTTPVSSYYKALKSLVGKGKRPFFIVDGLDEGTDIDHETLANAVEELSGRAKILLVSRPERWVEYEVARRARGGYRRLVVLEKFNEADISRLITNGVERLGLDDATSGMIADRLTQGANGMFLWATLMLRHVAQQTTFSEIHSALTSLPDGLEEVYSRIINRISSLPSNRARLASRALQWTFSAVRPLSVPELCMALAVEPGSKHHDQRNTVSSLKVILECCSPLLEHDEARNSVRFVHASAVDFLKHAGQTDDLVPGLPIISDIRNGYTAAVCITYLAYENVGFVPPSADIRTYQRNLKFHLEENVFLEYCALNWWKHLPLEEDTSDKLLVASVQSFISNEHAIVKWIQAFLLLDGPRLGKINGATSFQPKLRQYDKIIRTSPDSQLSKLWLAPSGLFVRWDRWITDCFFNGRYATPIGIAAFFDFAGVVASELARGIGVDEKDVIGFTPLILTAHGDSPEALELLLERGADVNAITHIGYGAARYASRNCTTVLPRVMEAGTSVAFQDRTEGWTALHAACISVGWHPSVLEKLLEYATPEDVNMADYTGRTALHLASGIKVNASVNLLIGRFFAEEGESRPQLRAVSRQEAFAPILPSSVLMWADAWGFNLSTRDRIELTRELTSLVLRIKTTMILMLSEKGAHPDIVDTFGNTALHLAAASGSTGSRADQAEKKVLSDSVIKSLLDAGASRERQNWAGETPLDVALANGCWSAGLSLLTNGEPEQDASENESSRLKALITESGLSKPDAEMDPQSMFAAIEGGSKYYPASDLDVIQVSYTIRSLLSSLSSETDVGPSGRFEYAQVVVSILDYAEYWTKSNAEVNLESDGFADKSPSATLRIGKGRVRRVEIYISRSRSAKHHRQSRLDSSSRSPHGPPPYTDLGSSDYPSATGLPYGSGYEYVATYKSTAVPRADYEYADSADIAYDSGPDPYLNTPDIVEYDSDPGSYSDSSVIEWGKDHYPADVGSSNHLDTPYKGGSFGQNRTLFHLCRWRRGEAASSADSRFAALENPDEEPKCVSAAPSSWESIKHGGPWGRGSLGGGDQVWKQVWPPPNTGLYDEHAHFTVMAEAQGIARWMESLKEGEEICLAPAEEFFVQDVALYSRYGFAVYMSVDVNGKK